MGLSLGLGYQAKLIYCFVKYPQEQKSKIAGESGLQKWNPVINKISQPESIIAKTTVI